MLTYPANPKSKTIYFIKRREEAVTVENLTKLLIFGDMAPNPVEELSVLVEEVNIDTQNFSRRYYDIFCFLRSFSCRFYQIRETKEDGPNAWRKTL